MAHSYNPDTLEVEAEGLRIQVHSQLYSKSETSLCYMSPCTKSVSPLIIEMQQQKITRENSMI